MAMTVDSAQWLLSDITSSLRHTEEVLSLVGLYCIGKITLTTLWDVASGFRAHFWSRLVKRNFVQEYGKWAVVTGATNGFGKGYAITLAKNGLNIVLISHTPEKLEGVAQEIRDSYGVETEIVNADFADGKPVYDGIKKHLKGKEIGILVNSVGMMIPDTCFKNMTLEGLWALNNVNVASAPSMMNLVLPGMLARKKGAIINIRLSGSFFHLPLIQSHRTAKALVNCYSQAINCECQTSGITVQTVIPIGLSTNKFLYQNPSRLAAHALSTLGYAEYTTGYWIHGILVWFTETIPGCLAVKYFMLGIYG